LEDPVGVEGDAARDLSSSGSNVRGSESSSGWSRANRVMADAEQHDVVVIGGSQAGLCAGYYLKRAGVYFAILDAADQVGDAWRRRWDSLTLFTVARYSSLPGLDFPGDPEHFPGKDEVADYLRDYARTFDLPIRLERRATRLVREDGRLRVEAGGQAFEADNAIVSTGAYQQPHVPDVSEGLADEVTQLHSSDYRNPDQLPDGDVLVVGAANSGAQIAEELSASRHVSLAVGTKPPRLPRRILGKSLHWWGDHLGLLRFPIARFRGAKASGDLLIGTSYKQLERRHGIEFRGRVVRAEGRVVQCADGSSVEPAAIVWATGFRPDYSWIDLPAFDERGVPIHRRGVTNVPGLYFLGMHLQYSLGSSLIGFVRHDAKHIVGCIAPTPTRESSRRGS
jgi:putative flavoprotein involved in K+ transport